MPTADPTRTAWWARLSDPGGPGRPAERVLVGVLSAGFPADSVVELPGTRRPVGWQVAVRTDPSGERVHAVEVALPEAPLLWYVELPEPEADPPATTLVAFSDSRHAEGALLDRERARTERIGGDRQVGAIRWWHRQGLVHQIYVGPAHRRRGVAGKLVQAAFALQTARGGPDLHDDGQRTDLGERFAQGLPDYAAWRLAPWTHRLPPMTPGEREDAVTAAG